MSDANKVFKHESYGVAKISHVSGLTHLYGSAVPHLHYMSLGIYESHMVRDEDGHYDRHVPDKMICEVLLSGVQLAELITNTNTYSGVPCTLNRVPDGNFELKSVKMPEKTTSKKEDYEKEFAAKMRTMTGNLEKAIEISEELEKKTSVTKSERKQMTERLTKLHTELVHNLPFILSQFTEKVESVTNEAKSEVEAHRSAIINQLGMEALKTKILGDIPKQ